MPDLRPLVRAGAVLGLLGAGVLTTEAVVTSRRTYLGADTAPPVHGVYGDPAAPELRLVVLGDSTAAGVGATATDTTVGAAAAEGLAADGNRVVLTSVAVSGSRAHDLGPQVSRALLGRPDVALVLIGANDGTHLTGLARVRSSLADTTRRLHVAGVPVVVGTCPDLGAARNFPQPLRLVAGFQGRRVAAEERAGVRAAGGTVVDLAAATGPAFRRDRRLLSEDGFHPSDAGYRAWAAALLPALRRVVGTRLPA